MGTENMEQTDTAFAELAIQRGLASREQVDECAEIVRKARELGAVTNLADKMIYDHGREQREEKKNVNQFLL